MAPKVLATSDDGVIKYIPLTSEYAKEALKCMKNAFFLHENVCNAVGFPQNLQAIPEMDRFILELAKNDGMSYIALDSSKNVVCGVTLNKLNHINNGEIDLKFMMDYAESCKSSTAKGLVKYLIDAEGIFDFFKECKIDCLLEIVFIGTLPEYRRQGIAEKLCKVSIDMASQLKQGNNVKSSWDGKISLPLEPVPEIITALFTAYKSQYMGKKLGFTKVATVSYDLYCHEEKTFSSVIGPETPDFTIEYLKL